MQVPTLRGLEMTAPDEAVADPGSRPYPVSLRIEILGL
jgi:hypothetical protein